MDEDLFIKILKSYDHFSKLYDCNSNMNNYQTFGNSTNHFHYKLDIKEFYIDFFEVIKQFDKKPFSKFRNNDVSSNPPIKIFTNNYFETNLYNEDLKKVSIHKGLSNVIFYYLLDEISTDVELFLTYFNEKEKKFRDNFSDISISIKKSNESKRTEQVSFNITKYPDFMNFFSGKIQNFVLAEKLLFSGKLITNENSKIIINNLEISKYLEELKRYNFDGFELV